MPAGDGIDVTPADLVLHAGHLDGVADALATACQAGDTVRFDVGAYGVLCGFVPAVLDGLQRVLTEGIGSAQHSVTDSAGRLRTSARIYEHTDGTAGASFHRIRAAL